MLSKIILASKSGVRKDILDKNNIKCIVEPSNVDENPVKERLLKEKEQIIKHIMMIMLYIILKDNIL